HSLSRFLAERSIWRRGAPRCFLGDALPGVGQRARAPRGAWLAIETAKQTNQAGAGSSRRYGLRRLGQQPLNLLVNVPGREWFILLGHRVSSFPAGRHRGRADDSGFWKEESARFPRASRFLPQSPRCVTLRQSAVARRAAASA